MVKSRQRLDYGRLAEVLAERGIVDSRALQDALQFSARGGPPFPEALVTANLVADWELSRLVCEIFGLPFLTVEFTEPDPKASAGLDSAFLIENGIVPLSRHGSVLTVLMPSLTASETLDYLGQKSGLTVLPVVGTVRSNRQWLEQKLATAPTASQTQISNLMGTADAGGDWSNLFDDADAAVLLDLKPVTPEDQGA
jgi:Type II secretion system (T2SS), protein E, N-terminal domain